MPARIDIAVASPGDVQQERDAVPRIFNRWNDANDFAFLHPRMWESSSVPTLGDHPQHILNDSIVEKSDLLVAILWSKLGTPTPTASSGTVEEIREFIKLKGPRRVMLYFCKRDLPYNTDPVELGKLRAFKDQMHTQGLYHEFTTQEEFERDLYRHLDVKIEEFISGKLPLPPSTKNDEERAEAKVLNPDKRLHQPIDFGATLEEIAQKFALRMDEFDAIDGVHPNKFYALASHVYSSVAICVDRFLAFSSSQMSEQNRRVIERISARLKHLASELPDTKSPFPQYWVDGREISDALSAQAAHLQKWSR